MYPPEVIQALKDALRDIYWYKNDLRRFFRLCDIPNQIVSKQSWEDPKEYKVRIVNAVLDELIAMGDEGVGPMRRLIRGVIEVRSFAHLLFLEDGAKKATRAQQSVEALRGVVLLHDEALKTEVERREPHPGRVVEALRRRNEEVGHLSSKFFQLVGEVDPQRRGRMFQEFLYDLFLAHDLNPRGPFNIVGEQIDGAFEFEATQYLLEAKWTKEAIGAAPVDSFSKKVERKLENTLGLFISLNGFTEQGLEAIRSARPCVILMDGEDLAIVLQGLVDFRDLLKRKVQHAAHTGNPFLRARQLNVEG